MADHKKFRRILAVAFVGEGDTEAEADADAVALMDRVNISYQAGQRVTDEIGFHILLDVDPGSGPGNIRVADVVLYGHKDGDDD